MYRFAFWEISHALLAKWTFLRTFFQDRISVSNGLNPDQDKRIVGHARTQMRGMGPRPISIENHKFYHFYWKNLFDPPPLEKVGPPRILENYSYH